ncbi:MAG: PAS domain-containing protein [Salinibacter sp.]
MPTTSSQPESAVSKTEFGSASKTESAPHVPSLEVDRDGTIQDLNKPARRALEYPSDASIDRCFFSHVHGHNLRRVMRDLAHMVSHRKQRARWLLRLRTGNGRWRWYRTVARNHLDHSDAVIQIHLRPL